MTEIFNIPKLYRFTSRTTPAPNQGSPRNHQTLLLYFHRETQHSSGDSFSRTSDERTQGPSTSRNAASIHSLTKFTIHSGILPLRKNHNGSSPFILHQLLTNQLKSKGLSTISSPSKFFNIQISAFRGFNPRHFFIYTQNLHLPPSQPIDPSPEPNTIANPIIPTRGTHISTDFHHSRRLGYNLDPS